MNVHIIEFWLFKPINDKLKNLELRRIAIDRVMYSFILFYPPYLNTRVKVIPTAPSNEHIDDLPITALQCHPS